MKMVKVCYSKPIWLKLGQFVELSNKCLFWYQIDHLEQIVDFEKNKYLYYPLFSGIPGF